jgi:hypothetical protein
MSNNEIIRIFKAELKENLILRQIYYLITYFVQIKPFLYDQYDRK